MRGLATFSGHETEVQERIELPQLLERVMQGFQFELQNQHLTVALEADARPRVTGDRYALEQLFTNLIANAIQVSPPAGRIRVETKLTAERVQVRISDEGPGVPPEVMSRLFDPFFTTKAPGQGMGMGLAVAHGIARSHGGTIRVENLAGGGACFLIELPARVPAAGELEEREIPRPALAPKARNGVLRLLVIEDEPMLCEMLRSIGRQNGWHVETAGSGREGLCKLSDAGEPYDVVLCDLRMASPSGIEIHNQLARERPELLERFLFVTGDLSSEEAAEFAERCKRPILRKPFQIVDLVRHVDEAAASAAAPA